MVETGDSKFFENFLEEHDHVGVMSANDDLVGRHLKFGHYLLNHSDFAGYKLLSHADLVVLLAMLDDLLARVKQLFFLVY